MSSRHQAPSSRGHEGSTSHPSNIVAQRDSQQLASAKELDSSFGKGYSHIGKFKLTTVYDDCKCGGLCTPTKPIKPFLEQSYTCKVSRNPSRPQMDRIDFKNKGTELRYRKRIHGSVDQNGNLKEPHTLNFAHFVRFDRITSYEEQQKEFYDNVEFWKTVVGSFSRRMSTIKPNGTKRY